MELHYIKSLVHSNIWNWEPEFNKDIKQDYLVYTTPMVECKYKEREQKSSDMKPIVNKIVA